MKFGISMVLMVLSVAKIEGLIILPVPFCFDPSTTVELGNGQEITVEKLNVGDQIVSCISKDNCESRYVDHVTDVTVIEEGGPFPAHNFIFENQRQINVTSPHIMYVEENGEMITKAAKDVKVQDSMKFIDGSYSRVVQVIDFNLAKKVSINTAGGSFFANEVLTTGMCDSYQEDDLNVLASTVLTSYADSHEGLNNCILAQKDLSMSPNVFAPACLSQLS